MIKFCCGVSIEEIGAEPEGLYIYICLYVMLFLPGRSRTDCVIYASIYALTFTD